MRKHAFPAEHGPDYVWIPCSHQLPNTIGVAGYTVSYNKVYMRDYDSLPPKLRIKNRTVSVKLAQYRTLS